MVLFWALPFLESFPFNRIVSCFLELKWMNWKFGFTFFFFFFNFFSFLCCPLCWPLLIISVVIVFFKDHWLQIVLSAGKMVKESLHRINLLWTDCLLVGWVYIKIYTENIWAKFWQRLFRKGVVFTCKWERSCEKSPVYECKKWTRGEENHLRVGMESCKGAGMWKQFTKIVRYLVISTKLCF